MRPSLSISPSSFYFKTKTKALVLALPSLVLQAHSYLVFAFLVVSLAMASNSKLITFEGEHELQHPNLNELLWPALVVSGAFLCL